MDVLPWSGIYKLIFSLISMPVASGTICFSVPKKLPQHNFITANHYIGDT